MKYFVIAGEASGDLHGSYLIEQLLKKDSGATVHAWGGDKMYQKGAVLLKHINELAFMGFVEVIQNISTIMKNFKLCKQQILDFKPDVVILVDYPGFNLRIAKWAKQNAFKTVYYISPQIWAWKENRVYNIKKYVDKMLCILPFEKDFYKKFDYEVSYVGHPLTHIVEQEIKIPSSIAFPKPVFALIPGSRLQEVKKKLPIMLSIVDDFPEFQFVVAQSPTLDSTIYEHLIQHKNVVLLQNKTYDILKTAQLALVTSGTATLETALFNVPQIVCYKGNSVSVWLAKKLITLKYISLVNIIADRKIVAELIQEKLTHKNLLVEIKKLLTDQGNSIKQNYKVLRHELGETNAAENAAQIIIEFSASTHALS